MNAMEHGNHYNPDIPVVIEVLGSKDAIGVRVTDRGGGPPSSEPETPDLAAKLAGLQNPRGWGLFLIKNMVDEMHVQVDENTHTVEIILHREGTKDGD
jgi:anti-sigma regulatory factor (Ser/Thr protein kinase)